MIDLPIPLEETELDLLSGDLLSYRKSKPAYPESGEHPVWGKVIRISPRSYYAGVNSGWTIGLVIGFSAGVLFMCLVMANMI